MTKKYNYKKTPGRPSSYTIKLANEICLRLSSGESLRQICRSEHMPDHHTVLRWALNNKEFYTQYAQAREMQADVMFDEILDIADDGSNDWMERELSNGMTVEVENKEAVNRSRLRVDTRKWYLSKVLPKKYGEKVSVGMEVVNYKYEDLKDKTPEELRAEAMRLANGIAGRN